MGFLDNENIIRLKGYLKRYRRYYFAGSICVFFGSLATLVHPMILGYVIDSLRKEVSWNRIIYPGVIIIVVEAIGGIFKYFMRQTIIKSSRYIEFDMRNDLFAALQRQSASYFQRIKTGDVMSRATSDIQTVRMMIGPGILQSAALFTRMLFSITLMIYISFKLTVLALLPLPILTIITRTLGSKIHRQFKSVQEQYANLTARVQENISGIRIIKAYTQEENQIRDFKRENQSLYDKNMKMFHSIGIFHSSFRLFTGIAAAITLWYGGIQVIHQRISLGDFVAFSGYLALLTFPMIALGWVINLFQRGTTSLKRLNSIYNAVPDIKDPKTTRTPSDFCGDIEFKNLTFHYNSSKNDVLKSISLKIKGGTSLAIIGHTGSGKSTLVNLIPRIYDPPPKSLFIDGVDVLQIPLKELRENIGFATQEAFLFSDTIAENIAFSKTNHNKEEIKEASAVVNLDREIENFRDGYESMLGERGINLSGGQKQRTAIARALLKKPKILILDDPFSSVDTKTEDEILSSLKKIMNLQTTIIISHRISTVKDCDKIIVLSDGKIIQSGNHQELLKQEGTYRDLYKKQLIKEQLKREGFRENTTHVDQTN